jgi:hypothetical protein
VNAEIHTANRQSPPHVWHHLGVDEALRLLDVDPTTGLADDEVRRRSKKFGPNRIDAPSGTPAWRRQ